MNSKNKTKLTNNVTNLEK